MHVAQVLCDYTVKPVSMVTSVKHPPALWGWYFICGPFGISYVYFNSKLICIISTHQPSNYYFFWKDRFDCTYKNCELTIVGSEIFLVAETEQYRCVGCNSCEQIARLTQDRVCCYQRLPVKKMVQLWRLSYTLYYVTCI